MKKLTRISLALVIGMVLLSSGVAMANPTVTSPPADVTATVVVQLTITRDFHLAFPGVIVQGASKTVAPAGGGTGGSAQFTVTGAAGASVTITVPATATISLPAPVPPGGTMSVTLTPLGGDVGTRVIPTAAPHTLLVRVGGTVGAAATQPAGVYTGTFTITAVYL